MGAALLPRFFFWMQMRQRPECREKAFTPPVLRQREREFQQG